MDASSKFDLSALKSFKVFIYWLCYASTMELQISSGFVVLILIFAVVIVMRYLLLRKTRKRLWKRYYDDLQEQEVFLKTFDVAYFDDFSSFDFRRGGFSHVSPFPKRIEGEWRYIIYLSRSEVEGIVTITHEISECTIGRVIEKLLKLKKPLYLQRKENGKFWVRGKRQKYLVEHVMATLGEVDDLTHKELRQRLSKEDLETWLNLEHRF